MVLFTSLNSFSLVELKTIGNQMNDGSTMYHFMVSLRNVVNIPLE